jgi:hypothetical protein
MNTPMHSKDVSRLIFSLFLTFVGIAILGVSYWYTHLYLRPENILLRSLSHISSIESFIYKGNLHLTYEVPADQKTIVKEPLLFSSGFVGSYKKQQNEDEPRISFNGTINASDRTLSEFESKYINKNIYLYITSLANIGIIDNTKVTNQWIFVDLAKFPPQIANVFIVPFWKIDKVQIRTAISEFPISIVHIFDNEVQKDALVYHYQYHVNPLLLNSLFPDTHLDITNLEFGDGEVWIDTKKEMIVAMSFSLTKKQVERDAPQIKITGIIHFDDVNTSISIEPPSSSVPFQELIQNAVITR